MTATHPDPMTPVEMVLLLRAEMEKATETYRGPIKRAAARSDWREVDRLKHERDEALAPIRGELFRAAWLFAPPTYVIDPMAKAS